MSSTAITHTLTGHCLCKAVTIQIDGAAAPIDICHCAMCRRWSGGGPFAGITGAAFEVSGEEAVRVFASSNWAERAFCVRCGSNLWFRFKPADHHSFCAGLFELPADFAIEQQIFIDEKPGWYAFSQESATKTGPEVVAQAIAMGYSFD